MAKVICEREDIVAIADAVRNKNGGADEMTLGGIVSGINDISTGSNTSVETCTVTLDNEWVSGDCYIDFVTALVFEEGVCQTYTYFRKPNDNNCKMTIPNVVCGTIINLGSTFHYGATEEPYIEISGSAIFDSWCHMSNTATTLVLLTFTAPSVVNEDCTISYSYNAL